MAISTVIIAIAAFLSVSSVVVFVVLVIGIHKGDRGRHLSDAPGTSLDAFTRSFLGIGIRRNDHNEG